MDSVWFGIEAFGGGEGDVRRFVGDRAEEGIHVGGRVYPFAIEINHWCCKIAEFAYDNRNIIWKFRVFNELRKENFEFSSIGTEAFIGAAILFALMPKDAMDFGRPFGLLCLEDGVVVEQAAWLPIIYGCSAIRARDETTLHISIAIHVRLCK